MKFLKWKNLNKLSRYERYPLILQQINQQYQYLLSHRLKRYDILLAYENCIKLSNSTSNLDDWIQKSYQNVTSVHELFIADGIKWKRQLNNNLNEAVTDICSQTIFTQLLLNSLQEEQNEMNIINMNQFCTHIAEDIDALTKEKFGACPQITVDGDIVLYDHRSSLIQFCIVEILKNSIYAVIKKYGVLDLDEALPIRVQLDAQTHQLILQDCGVGMTESEKQHCFQAFYTTTPLNLNPTYQYSREFGVPYSGAGFGMLKSKIYLEFHEANIILSSRSGEGTTVIISFHQGN